MAMTGLAGVEGTKALFVIFEKISQLLLIKGGEITAFFFKQSLRKFSTNYFFDSKAIRKRNFDFMQIDIFFVNSILLNSAVGETIPSRPVVITTAEFR